MVKMTNYLELVLIKFFVDKINIRLKKRVFKIILILRTFNLNIIKF